MKLIVGVDDGIILDVSRCVIVDSSDLGDADRALLETGTETESLSVANRLGVRLDRVLEGCGYGSLNYTNAISYDPQAIRQEIMERLPLLADGVADEEDKTIVDLLAWALTLSDIELSEIGHMILSDESPEVWGDYLGNIVLGVAWWKRVTESGRNNGDPSH